jgi:hypothetical protein
VTRDPAPITDLAAYRASKQPAPKPRPLVGVREVNGALELYFRQGKVRVDVPVSLETAVGYAGDILQLVREMRGTMNARSLVGMTMGARKRAARKRTIAPFRYEAGTAPDGYQCEVCWVQGVKLWREYQTFANHTRLYCAACALQNQSKPGPVDSTGRRQDEDGIKTDQIGWLVPAVPTEDGDSFWGYLSVPAAGCKWWRDLPSYPSSVSPRVSRRTRYRIGERLRPCKWCEGPEGFKHCRLAGHEEHTSQCVYCRTCTEAKKTWRVWPTDPPPCDGSGVLPAKGGGR